MRLKKGKKVWLAIVELEKAYRLSWKYIEDTLGPSPFHKHYHELHLQVDEYATHPNLEFISMHFLSKLHHTSC